MICVSSPDESMCGCGSGLEPASCYWKVALHGSHRHQCTNCFGQKRLLIALNVNVCGLRSMSVMMKHQCNDGVEGVLPCKTPLQGEHDSQTKSQR